MIRVLHIVGTMDLGGAETYIMNIYRNIDRGQIQFDFLCLNRVESYFYDEIITLGGRMFSIPSIRNSSFIKYEKNLYRFFVSHPEYKIVHSHLNRYNGVVLRQAKRANIPYRISHSHACSTNYTIIKRIQISFLKMYFYNNITHAFACSNKAGESLYIGKWKQCFVYRPDSIDTSFMKFNTQNRRHFRNEISANDEDIVIGHIGRFDKGKNHAFLLKVFACILKDKPTAILVLIGDGENKAKIEQLAIQYKIAENVRFLGNRLDIPVCLSGMDGFVFPSKYEGLGIVAIEAQASGLPVLVSTEVPEETSVSNLIKRESLETGANIWAQEIIRMINKMKEYDRSAYSEVVKRAGFDVELESRKMQEFYLHLLGGKV